MAGDDEVRINFFWPKPFHEYWKEEQKWRLIDAVFIVEGFEPPEEGGVHSLRNYCTGFVDSYVSKKEMERVDRLEKTYQLASRKKWSDSSYNKTSIVDNGDDTLLPPAVFLRWAQENGIPISDELKELLVDEYFLIDQLIEKTHEEIETLVSALRGPQREGGWGRFNMIDGKDSAKALAVEIVKKGSFQHIKPKHLEAEDLFCPREGKDRGDFIGKILVELSKDTNIKTTNFQYLFECYRTKYPLRSR